MFDLESANGTVSDKRKLNFCQSLALQEFQITIIIDLLVLPNLRVHFPQWNGLLELGTSTHSFKVLLTGPNTLNFWVTTKQVSLNPSDYYSNGVLMDTYLSYIQDLASSRLGLDFGEKTQSVSVYMSGNEIYLDADLINLCHTLCTINPLRLSMTWFLAAVWALLLEHTHPRIATDVHYVAGDRVVQDPLCKPFSMGRNLFCVHSKKHMDDDLALRDEKMRTNRQTLVKLSKELNKVTLFPTLLSFLSSLSLGKAPRTTIIQAYERWCCAR